VRAVPAQTPPTGGALPAGVVDLADHPSAGELRRAVDDVADELVAGNPGEAHVAGQDLEVGGADPGETDTHDGFAGPGGRFGMVVEAAEHGAVEVQGPHQAAR
jgi:hypothetical protein